MNYGGNFYVTNLYATTDLRSSVLNTSGSTKTAGYFDNGSTNPSHTNRLNYDGTFYVAGLNSYYTSGSAVSGTSTTSGYGIYGTGSSGSGGVMGVSADAISGYFTHNGNTTSSQAIVYIDKATTGSANSTGVLLSITDHPSTSGTISGSLIKGSIASTTVLDFNPRTANGASAVAYSLASYSSYTGNARIFELKNTTTDKFYVKNDSTVVKNYLIAKDSIYAKGGYHNVTKYAWFYRDSVSGAFKVDSSVINSKFGLEMEIPNLEEQLSDRKNGEMAWYLSPTEKSYGIEQLLPNQRIRALMASSELDKRRILQLQKDVAILESRLKKLEKQK